MKHTVLVPAWRRPDMLYACLLRLSRCAPDSTSVVVSLDRGHSPECVEVAEEFAGSLPGLRLRTVPRHSHHGNSFNVLSGLAECLEMNPDLVHVVEDDVFVSDGYFDFHEAMHEVDWNAFAVSACRNQNGEDRGHAYRHPSYQSLAVSMRPEIVMRCAAYATPDYFTDMIGYCRRMFPRSAIPAGHAEQDGLINRVRESMDGETVYTSRPRAYHAGFYGYHREGSRLMEGTTEERARRLLAMSSEELNRRAGAIKDHEVVDLDERLSTEPEREALSSRT